MIGARNILEFCESLVLLVDEHNRPSKNVNWDNCIDIILIEIEKLFDWAKKIGDDKFLKIVELVSNSQVFMYRGNTPFFKSKKNKNLSFSVNCGDFFNLCCAQAEPCTLKDIDEIYEMYKDKKYCGWGAEIWCALKRKESPCEYVLDRMKKDGVDKNILDKILFRG